MPCSSTFAEGGHLSLDGSEGSKPTHHHPSLPFTTGTGNSFTQVFPTRTLTRGRHARLPCTGSCVGTISVKEMGDDTLRCDSGWASTRNHAHLGLQTAALLSSTHGCGKSRVASLISTVSLCLLLMLEGDSLPDIAGPAAELRPSYRSQSFFRKQRRYVHWGIRRRGTVKCHG